MYEKSKPSDHKLEGNKAIAVMRGKSSRSEHVLEKIKSNNSLGSKEDLERDIISMFISFTCILISRIKMIKKVFLIRLKLDIFTHHYKLNTKFAMT